MKNTFESHIHNLILKEDNFIYKTNLELLRLFYNFLYTKFNDEELCELYLGQFNSISDITSSKIESNFSNIIFEYKFDIINDDFDVIVEHLELTSGVYCIYNDIDNLIYVGKTNNFHNRPIISFLNKLPYGASYIKLLGFSDKIKDEVEALMIDYYLPMYNNKKEILPINITYRSYSRMIEIIKNTINSLKPIYVLNK